MLINGVDFTPHEIQAIFTGLDQMEAENLEHVDSIGEDPEDKFDKLTRESYVNEARIANQAQKKFREVLNKHEGVVGR